MSYSSYYMWKKGVGSAEVDTFTAAEQVLELAAEHAEESGIWLLAASSPVERLVCLYDEQLAAVTKAVFYECEMQVVQAIARISHASVHGLTPVEKRAGMYQTASD
ncbi:hypothetical protein [Paraburkholderia nodosa]|uniref:hypothetical protein n=1 Tax=Paraburkholderia nodosa TaxID=392320 RepID=UPI00048023E2|nr:hypothetical protein [Paraburkholderia nodosa]